MTISNIQNVQPLNQITANQQTNLSNQSKDTAPVEAIQKIDTFEKQSATSDSVTYEPIKKLSAEQVEEINRQRMESTVNMVSDSIRQTIETQAEQSNVMFNGFDLTSDSADLLTEIFGSLENALPIPATTAEGALANVSEGGSYSVESVSERIMLMATTLSKGNEEMLAEMEKAVVKGFEQAGFNIETGEGMPDITTDTYNHVMSQFEALRNPTEQPEESPEKVDQPLNEIA